MRIYTKEWHILLESFGNIDMFEPIEDKEYSDEDIVGLYQKMLEKYLNEEEGSAVDFEEEYRDALEDPDMDIPKWVRDSVDPRLIALGLLPESVYNKLEAEEAENEKKFDELDAEADRLLDEMEELFPEEYEEISDELDELLAEYVSGVAIEDGNYIMELAIWGEEEDQSKRKVVFKNAEFIENEEPVIHSQIDEDGDIETDCELADCEVYFENDAFEVHMLLDNAENGFKYVTLRCDDITID